MAEKRTIELEIQDNSKSLKAQYREAVAELQRVSAQYGETSAEAVKAAKAAAELNDQIQYSKDLVSAFNPDAKFNALTKSVGGVLDGFQAFEGAMGLIGVEGENLQKTMLKVQSVMALSQGVQGLMEAKDSFKQLGTVAVNALKGIKAGISATGIGLLVIAVGTIVAYWDDIKELVNGVSAEQERLNKKTEANLKASEAKVDALNKQDNILRLQGKTEKQILQLKVASLDTAIKQAEINLANAKATKKAQLEAEKRNYIILRGVLEFLSAPLALLLRTVDELGKAFGKDFGLSNMIFGNITELVFNPSEVEAEGDAAIKAAEDKLIELRNTQAGYKLQIQQIEQQSANERNQITSKSNDYTTNSNEKAAKDQIDIQRRLEDEKLRLRQESRQKELDELDLKYKRLEEDAEKELANDVDKESKLKKLKEQFTESKRFDVSQINAKWDKIDYDNFVKAEEERFKAEDEQWNALQKLKNSQKEQELLDLAQSYDEKFLLAKNNAELEKELTKQFNKDQAAIIKKYKDQEEADQKERDAKDLERRRKKEELILMSTKDSLQIASDLTQLFAGKSKDAQKKAFVIQKGINIANATVDTYGAATKALREYPSPFNYIAMAAAITTGLLNIKKIKQTQFETGSGGGGNNAPAGANAPAPMTANFSTIGSSGINQLAQLQQKPTQAYVVSGEVTSAQALDRNRVQNATL